MEAINYANSLKVVLPDVYYGKTAGNAKVQSISIAGLTQLEHVKFVIDQVRSTLAKGGTFQDFQKAVKANTLGIDLPKHRLDNIFRTNIQSAYAGGKYQQIQSNKALRPYQMYDAVNDSRTRPTHLAMDNTILPVDHPWWQGHTPPCGYRCRCTVIALTTKQAQARGISSNPPDVEADDEGFGNVPTQAAKDKETARQIDKAIIDAELETQRASARIAEETARLKRAAEVEQRWQDIVGDMSHLRDIVDQRAKEAGVQDINTLSKDSLDFVFNYTTGAYGRINKFLRTVPEGDLVAADVVARMRDAALKVREVLPGAKDKVLQRGIPTHRTDLFPKLVAAMGKVGTIVEQRSFVSTSVRKGFTGDVEFTIRGGSDKAIDLQRFTAHRGEGEYLFAPGERFRVVKFDVISEYNIKIELEWVPQTTKADTYFAIPRDLAQMAVSAELQDRMQDEAESPLSDAAWAIWTAVRAQ